MSRLYWSEEAPTEPGRYWFFGEPYMGAMGGHYNLTIPPRIELHHVIAHRISNGLALVCNGQFMSPHKWDGKKQGWLGLWLDCSEPSTANLIERIERLKP